MSAVNVVWERKPTYEKAFVRATGEWCIVENPLFNPVIIKERLTEAEANAFLKLLRS